jgi:progressive ankylosis protein
MIFLFRSGGVAFQEVGIALDSDREVGRTALLLGAVASLALAVVALTPLEMFWFERLSGLSHDLAQFAVWPVRILILYPALEYIASFQRARPILEHRTGVVTIATAIETFVLAATLFVAIRVFGMIGVVGGAIAMLAGRLAANAYLFSRRSVPAPATR